jgi:hypothetical protein
VPGNRINFIDSLDTTTITMEQAKGMLMGAPLTTVSVEVSTAPQELARSLALPPGARTLLLVRGGGEDTLGGASGYLGVAPPPKHDFYRQKRPVERDGLADKLSRSAAPKPAAEGDGASKEHLRLAEMEKEIKLLREQVRAAQAENRDLKAAQNASHFTAAEREELKVARILLADMQQNQNLVEMRESQNLKEKNKELQQEIGKMQLQAQLELERVVKGLFACVCVCVCACVCVRARARLYE